MAKNTKEKSLESILWSACDKLRGAVEPSEYKHVILSLIFLKYANDRFDIQRDKLKADFYKFKDFWHSLMKHFQIRIGHDKDEHYKYVSEDLYKNGIFDDNDKEIADNFGRKIRTIEELNKFKDIKKKNNDIRF